jgi:hypothetical protein
MCARFLLKNALRISDRSAFLKKSARICAASPPHSAFRVGRSIAISARVRRIAEDKLNKEDVMRNNYFFKKLPLLLAGLMLLGLFPVHAQEKAIAATTPAQTTVPVQMTVTLRVLGDGKRTPEVNQEDVVVRQGNKRLQVTGWTPARDGRAGLDLFILIDDSADQSVASQFGDLRSFITSQPPNAQVGVGYMRNGTVQIAQNFTTDHELAAKALRIPLASSGAYGSPYLSVIDLMKRWPADSNRRQVVMITDGIDRFRGGPSYRGLANISTDVDSASRVAQRTGTTIHTIFTRGVGRAANNFWDITNGQNGIAKLSDQTGGESYYMGTQNAVSFKPYLDSLQRSLDNQYLLEFHAAPGKKPAPVYVKLTTEVAGVELNSADSVWVNAN